MGDWGEARGPKVNPATAFEVVTEIVLLACRETRQVERWSEGGGKRDETADGGGGELNGVDEVATTVGRSIDGDGAGGEVSGGVFGDGVKDNGVEVLRDGKLALGTVAPGEKCAVAP